MAVICPTVTAFNLEAFNQQLERVTGFAPRLHIDLMDGQFAPTRSPAVSEISWPSSVVADVHLMYQQPHSQLEALLELAPNLVIIHAEAEGDLADFAQQLRNRNCKVGLALLPKTTVASVAELLPSFDHILLFSGDLGHHGGHADLSLLQKIPEIKAIMPEIEIGWDGGVNEENAAQLLSSGVEVLNVGGFIQNSPDPAAAYAKLNAAV